MQKLSDSFATKTMLNTSYNTVLNACEKDFKLWYKCIVHEIKDFKID